MGFDNTDVTENISDFDTSNTNDMSNIFKETKEFSLPLIDEDISNIPYSSCNYCINRRDIFCHCTLGSIVVY